MVAKDALLTVGVRAALVLVGLATTIITARWLGPAGRGDYFYVIALSAIAGQIVHLGLHASNAYYVAKDPKLFGALAVNSYWVSVILGVIAAGVAIALVGLTANFHHNTQTLYWALALTPASTATIFISALYVGAGRIAEYNVIQLAAAILPFALICLVAAFWRTAPAFLAASAIASVANQIVLATYSLRRQEFQWRFNIDLFRTGVPYAFRAYVVNTLGTMVLKAPALMFTAATSKAELGYFSIAAQIFDAISIFPASVAAILFPTLMTLDAERWRQTRRYMAILMGLSILIALLTASLSGIFVTVLFGRRFAGAVAPIRVILPAAVFVSGTSILSQFLATHGMPRSTALAWVSAAAVSIGCGPALVRNYGAVGAALALSLATGCAWVILLGLSMRVARRIAEPV